MNFKPKNIYQIRETILLGINKPKGVICSHKDERKRTKIYDLIPKSIYKKFKGNIHSVGRLDFNSQGLILITNNTRIKTYLEKPSSKITRVYRVKVQGIINKETINRIKEGIKIAGVLYSVISIIILKKYQTYTWVMIKLEEGKNQHIRKIFKKLGFSVNKLVRIQYGPYKIGTLSTGQTKFFNINKLKMSNYDNNRRNP